MALKQAREGTKSTIEHDIQSSRGQYFQAHTNLYRGSPTANELNPTFILAQTRFIGSNLTSSSPGISRSLREFGEVPIGLLDLLLRILILVWLLALELSRRIWEGLSLVLKSVLGPIFSKSLRLHVRQAGKKNCIR